jgi:hypothetical protein
MFAWNGISARSELGLLPPPLAGEGWEGVSARKSIFLQGLNLCACPLPIPPPQAGEGMPRARGVMFKHKRPCLKGIDCA